MPAPDDVGSLAQTEIFGRFVLLEQLDASGGAETCRAVDLERELQPIVTVRRLPRWGQFTKAEHEAFETASALRARGRATLMSPYVAHGNIGGVPFWATEYVPGISVDRVLERALDRGELSLHSVFTIAYCCSAVLLDLNSDGWARQEGSPLVAPLVHPRRVVVAWSGRPFFLGVSYEQARADDEERRYRPHTGRQQQSADAYQLAGMVFEMCTGLSFTADTRIDDAGPLGKVPAEARDAMGRALRFEMDSVRELLYLFEQLMKAAGGGLFDDVAREITGMFAAEHAAEQHQIERDAALARRFRRRLKAKTSIEAQTTKLRVRPASQEGLAVGDPLEQKKPPDDDMVLVKGGRFLFGTPEEPPSYIDVAPFLVDRFPVTNLDWQAFIEGGKGKRPRTWTDGFPHHLARCPVVGVEYQWVLDYAKWAGKRLPTEVEWELMARGFDGRLWPWGDVFDHEKMSNGWTLQIGARVPEPVGRHTPRGDSPFGACDIGQAWEWTSSVHVDGGFVVRGGAWRNRREPPMVTNRSREDVAAHDVTFRLVKSVSDLDDKTQV